MYTDKQNERIDNFLKSESVKDILKNVFENYQRDPKSITHPSYKAKCYGSMEMCLILLGVISRFEPYQYKMIEREFNLFWLIPIRYTRREKYFEMIDRLIKRTLHPIIQSKSHQI